MLWYVTCWTDRAPCSDLLFSAFSRLARVTCRRVAPRPSSFTYSRLYFFVIFFMLHIFLFRLFHRDLNITRSGSNFGRFPLNFLCLHSSKADSHLTFLIPTQLSLSTLLPLLGPRKLPHRRPMLHQAGLCSGCWQRVLCSYTLNSLVLANFIS